MRTGRAVRTVGRRGRAARRDEGFALISVIGTMGILMLLVLAATTYAYRNVPNSRRAQDYAAAMAAAQAGVDDFLARLNTCDTFWASPCSGAAAEVARDNWAVVPGSAGPIQAQYKYSIISTPTTTPGLIRIKAFGKVNGVQRTITADLRKDGFLQFIYYTDKESTAPALVLALYGSSYPGSTSNSSYAFSYGGKNGTAYKTTYSGLDAYNATLACGRYYYSVPPASGARSVPKQTKTVYWKVGGVEQPPVVTQVTLDNAPGCEINFIGGDVINGPLYTKDAMLLRTNAGTGPRFNGPVETYWQLGYDPAPSASSPWRANSATPGAVPDPAGYSPTIATRLLDLPPTNTAIRQEADPATSTQGCLYQGPTKIVLKSTGKMDVTGGTTTNTNPGCGPGVNLNLPANGVIYVDAATGTCPAAYGGKALGTYPIANDKTTYNCLAGDAFVQGTLNGQLTIATAGDIIVTDDLVYAQSVWNGTTINTAVDDVLGLVAQGFVRTYHPVKSDGTELAKAQVSNIEVDAAILSVDNSFTVQNFDLGETLGTLKVRGGIYQRHRGPVGQSNSSGPVHGYVKDYVYDTRLVSLPPPYFLEPASAPWRVRGLSE